MPTKEASRISVKRDIRVNGRILQRTIITNHFSKALFSIN